MKTKYSEPTSRQFPHLLLLEASAGSGKTYKLAGRFVEYLLSKRVPHNQLPNLLAVTFTNNAAREMKERILSWLKNLALDADPDQMRQTSEALEIPTSEIKKLASDMVDQVIGRYSDFQVQTIDSFTNRLAQASARELGFRPDFKITTGYDDLMDEAIALLFRRIGPGRDAGLTAVMDRFLSLVNSGSTTYVWDPQPRMREKFVSFLKVEAKESGRFVFADTGAVIDRCLAEIVQVHAEVSALAAAHELSHKPGKLVEYLEARNVERVLDREQFKGSPLTKGKAKGEQLAAYTATAELWEGLRPAMAELAVAWAIAGMAAYHLPYLHFKSELEQVKRRSGTHHIDDIASRLAGFLRQEMIPEIYLKLGSRLFHYMIDEFQDTDPAQWRSMLPLLDEALATQGSAFMVGDLKQAIYMFRKADYRIMKQLKQEIKGERPRDWLPASVAENTSLENLEHNHRSGQVIVDYVAGVFQHNLKALIDQGRFGSDRTDLTSYQQLPWKTQLGHGFVSVRHFEQPRDGDATPDTAPVRQAVLEIIADARARGYGHQDIAILADKNDQLEQAIGWLTEAGIPASSSSGLDIRKRRVVAELLELLRWLDSPIDNLAWAATVSGEMLGRAARGDGFAWDDAAAAGLLLSTGQRLGGKGYLYRACSENASFRQIWERYFKQLYQLVGFSPVYDLICLAVGRFNVFKSFPDEAAAVLKLLEAVNQLEADGITSVRDFLDICAKEKDDHFGLELPEHMQGVKLMTFYKAKGMGFPVVINLFSDGRRKGPDAYYRKEGAAITVYRLTDRIAGHTAGFSPDLRSLKDEFEADGEVQELNSLYVACTRAADELHNLVSFQGPDMKGKQSAYALLFPVFEKGQRGSPRKAGDKAAVPPHVPDSVLTDELPCEWQRQDPWNAARLAETRRGEFFHRVLQGIELLPDDAGDLIAKLVAAGRDMLPDADPAVLAEEVGTFLARPQVACWFAPKPGRTVQREVEFIDQDGHVVRMDRLVRDVEGLAVIDFKTGGEAPRAKAQHHGQVRRYLEVLSQAHPGTAISGRLIYWDGTESEVRR